MRLTDVQIKLVKPSTGPYKVSDGARLFLWVTPPGGKIWRWTYRHEGREKLTTFGSYPDVSLSLARERHAAARKLLATGTGLMAERKAERRRWRIPSSVLPAFGWLTGRMAIARAMWTR